MKNKYCFLLLLSALIPMISSGQPTLLGNTGLVIVPTARMDGDAVLRISGGYIPHPFYPVDKEQNDNYTAFLSMGYLPFLEITFGIVTPRGETYGIGDRTVSIRACLHRESAGWPQIVLGTQDPFGFIAQDWAQRYSTIYAVASKSFDPPLVERVDIHLGQGVDWIRAGQYYLIGTFGGLEVRPVKPVGLLLEYDTRNINYGLRLSVWRLDVLGAWLDGRRFTGNVSFHFSIHPRPISLPR